MTLQDLLGRLAGLMPSAHVTYDENGQVILHTGLSVVNGYLEELQTEEV